MTDKERFEKWWKKFMGDGNFSLTLKKITESSFKAALRIERKRVKEEKK